MKRHNSTKFYIEGQRYIPGGVNSPIRSFKSVGGIPLFIAKGVGSHVTDVDGNDYVDYVGSWGPLIHGHCHPEVVQALMQVLNRGTSFGMSTLEEVRLAKAILENYPSMQKVRLVNSGTEATMSAIRLARAFSGRDMVIKFDGCYHGHVDGLLVRAGSGVATLGLPDSAGVPPSYASLTVSVPYNNLEAVQTALAQNPGRIACVILEPVAGNMGVVSPQPGFLDGLRELTQREGALLIFDEVMTGFRVALGGAQELYHIAPDLTCLGKILGGGLPVGAFGGRDEIMKMVAPDGPVYQAGTLSGNPLAVTAGFISIRLLRRPGLYERLERLASKLCEGLRTAAQDAQMRVTINRVGSMFTLFFNGSEVFDYATAQTSNTKLYASFFQEMLRRGVLFPPSQFEAAFVSLAHDFNDINTTTKAAAEALQVISRKA